MSARNQTLVNGYCSGWLFVGLCREFLPKQMNEIAMQVLGGVTLVLGMQMALRLAQPS